MADILQDQFNSVFSDPNCPYIQSPDFPQPNINKPFSQLLRILNLIRLVDLMESQWNY